MILRYLFAWLLSACVTTLLCSLISSYFVLAGLAAVGVDISLDDRLAMTLHDLGIFTTLLLVVSASFLIGFMVATLASRWLGGKRLIWLLAAGFSAVICALLLLEVAFQLMPIAGARSTAGLISMGLAGLLGAYVFAHFTRNMANSINS